jgi:hypothetical protein
MCVYLYLILKKPGQKYATLLFIYAFILKNSRVDQLA